MVVNLIEKDLIQLVMKSVEMWYVSSSRHIDNKKKDILVLGKGPTQGLEHTLTAEKLYSFNFVKENTKFCLRLHYNGAGFCAIFCRGE